MKEYGPIHTVWSASEEDLVDTLNGIASCIDQCCKATEKQMSGLSEVLLPVVHEYVLYSEILMVSHSSKSLTAIPCLILSLCFHHSFLSSWDVLHVDAQEISVHSIHESMAGRPRKGGLEYSIVAPTIYRIVVNPKHPQLRFISGPVF